MRMGGMTTERSTREAIAAIAEGGTSTETAAYRAYGWLVRDDLSVLSFIDMPDLDTLPADPAVARAYFGGIPA